MPRSLPVPANDNRQRPAEFDKRVLDHMPVIKSMAKRMVPAADRMDFIQDALMYIFANWTNFRGVDYSSGSGFYNWLRWQVRAVFSARAHRIKAAPKMAPVEAIETITTPATQERVLIAKDMLSKLPRDRGGRILLRRAKGETLWEIGKRYGVTGNRIDQIAQQAREKFVKKVAA